MKTGLTMLPLVIQKLPEGVIAAAKRAIISTDLEQPPEEQDRRS
jgi:hypothetical protein